MYVGLWSSGPRLPSPLNAATVVQLETTFLAVGGVDTEGFTGVDPVYADTVLEFDVVNMDWVVRPERLNVARSSAFVTAVDAELYCDP